MLNTSPTIRALLEGCYQFFDSPVTLIFAALASCGIVSIWIGFNSLPIGVFPIILGGLATAIFGLLLLMTALSVLFHQRNAAMMESLVPKVDREELKELVDALEQLGYYKYADPWIVDKLKRFTVEHNDLYHEATRRSYSVYDDDDFYISWDYLDLLLAKLKPLLNARGLMITSFSQDFREDEHYITSINGIEYELYTQQDIAAERNIEQLIIKRTFKTLNTLLAQVGAEERIYRLSLQGSGLVFLTPAMFQLIKSSSALLDYQKPLDVDAEIM